VSWRSEAMFINDSFNKYIGITVSAFDLLYAGHIKMLEEQDLENILRSHKIDVRIIGEEYQNEN